MESRRTIIALTLLPETVWNSVVSVATEDRLFLCASALSGPVLSLCGLPLCGWAVVAPRWFLFTITALAVDRGSSRRAEIWQTCWKGGLLWHGHIKSWSSSVWPFYLLPMFAFGDCMSLLYFIHPLSEIDKFTSLKRRPLTVRKHTYINICH
jgi:hypothetical protein